MANVDFTVATPAGGVSTAADSNYHTILQILAPTNQRVKIRRINLGFQGQTVTNSPIDWELVHQSTAGSGGSSVTPIKTNGAGETVQTTAISGPSSEPTLTDRITDDTIHPQGSGGMALPLSEEIICVGGARIGLRIKDPGSVGTICRAWMFCEE